MPLFRQFRNFGAVGADGVVGKVGGLMTAEFLWGICTGEFEMPIHVEKLLPPSLGAASKASRGLYYRCLSEVNCTIHALRICRKYKSTPFGMLLNL